MYLGPTTYLGPSTYLGAPQPGSWWSLVSILRDARDPIFRQYVTLTCPNDGEPYTTGPDGERFCRYDGYRPGPDELMT